MASGKKKQTQNPDLDVLTYKRKQFALRSGETVGFNLQDVTHTRTRLKNLKGHKNDNMKVVCA